MLFFSARAALPIGLLLLTGSSFVIPAFQSTDHAGIAIIPRHPFEEREAPEVLLRSELSLVLVPVQAATRDGSAILGLKAEDFRISEDGNPQEISYFAQDDSPVSIGFLFDSSASMKNKKRQSLDASAAFFKTANADDEFFLIEFDEQPRLSVPFTRDARELLQRIDHVRPYGRTSLFDSIHLALGTMKKAQHDRKALVIVSDGGDNRSRLTFNSVRADLLESDVQLYAMGIFESKEEEPKTQEEANGPEVLEQLADLSGGRHFPVSADNLATISSRIGTLLRNRYLVGYTSSNTVRDGKYRRVTVEVSEPAGIPTRLQHRKGYYAPQR